MNDIQIHLKAFVGSLVIVTVLIVVWPHKHTEAKSMPASEAILLDHYRTQVRDYDKCPWCGTYGLRWSDGCFKCRGFGGCGLGGTSLDCWKTVEEWDQ